MREIVVVSCRQLTAREYEKAIWLSDLDVVRGEVGPSPMLVSKFSAPGRAYVMDATAPEWSPPLPELDSGSTLTFSLLAAAAMKGEG